MKFKALDIKKINEGDSICSFFICKNFNIKFTRLGDEYIDCILENKTGSIRAKIWSFISDFKNRISANSPIAVKGDIISYNNELEVKISSVNIVDPEIYKIYGYNENSLIKSISDNKDKLFSQFQRYVDNLKPDYKRLINKIIKDNYKRFVSFPSIDEPYKLKGGFLKQIVSLLELNERIYSRYKHINNNTVQAGIILKNIGCIYYFNDDFQFSVSDKNQKAGHKLYGINIINDYAMSYVNFSHDIKTELQNIILSENHQNDVNIKYINSIYAFDLNVN